MDISLSHEDIVGCYADDHASHYANLDDVGRGLAVREGQILTSMAVHTKSGNIIFETIADAVLVARAILDRCGEDHRC